MLVHFQDGDLGDTVGDWVGARSLDVDDREAHGYPSSIGDSNATSWERSNGCMKRLALLTLAACLPACAPMQWVKEGVSSEDFRRDQQECQQLAWREASARYWLYQPMGPVFVADPRGGGAMVWPSGAVVDPYGYQMLEENRLAQFCMESKGYRLEPAPKQ